MQKIHLVVDFFVKFKGIYLKNYLVFEHLFDFFFFFKQTHLFV